MSEPDEPGLDELRAQLDAAFASARPRPGFTDELWERLRARRPWWRRLGLPGVAVPWPALGAVAVVLLLGVLVVLLPRSGGGSAAPSAGAAPGAATPASRSDQAAPGGASAQALPSTGATVPNRFGPLPAPPPAPKGGAGTIYDGPAALTVTATPPAVPARLPVYRYPQALGPADGTVFELGGLPSVGDDAGSSYPTRAPAQAARDAATAPPALPTGASPEPAVTLGEARLVYVAVVAGGLGYLEPAYLFTGAFQSGGRTYEKQVLVSAIDPAQLR